MELDDRKTDQQLTSNMGSVLTSPNDKTETGDSTPTSSTDASTKTKESGSGELWFEWSRSCIDSMTNATQAVYTNDLKTFLLIG